MDDQAIVAELARDGCTDGLPIVAPTIERVERMVVSAGIDGDISLGSVPPRGGDATVRTVAANAVMAGCDPDMFPVVVAAVKAVLHPEFDLDVVQTTTNAVAPFVVVNGPARSWCGSIRSGFGALGPGSAANLLIGRALRFVLMNIGGATPGGGDLAVLGHGGKLASCLAENEEDSTIEPLHVARGWQPDDSVVTVFGVEGPYSVVHIPVDDAGESFDLLTRLIGHCFASEGLLSTYSGGAAHLIVLNPDHADVVRRAGRSRVEFLAAVAQHSSRNVAHLRATNPAVMELKRSFWDVDGGADEICAAPADKLSVVVAGGRGNYSFILPSWGGGKHQTRPISERIEVGEACSVPWMT